MDRTRGDANQESGRVSAPRSGDPYYEDEIDLADYLKVLIKRKWLIAAGTVLCTLAAVVYQTTKVSPPTEYKATSTLMVMPPVVKTELSPPQYSLEVYQALAMAEDLMAAIVDSLSLTGGSGQRLTIPDLSAALEAQVLAKGGSSLMEFSVSSRDTTRLPPVKVVNTWAHLFVRKNDGIAYREVVGSSDYIMEQYRTAEAKLEEAQQVLNAFDRRFDLAAMRTELEAHTKKLTEYQNACVEDSLQMATDTETQLALKAYLLAQETPAGDWIGSLDVQNVAGDAGVEGEDQITRAVAQARDRLRTLKEQSTAYRNAHDPGLTRKRLDSMQQQLLGYLSQLSSLEVDAASVAESLRETGAGSNDARRDLPSVVGASESVIRELASLQMGANLLKPRQQYLLKEAEALKGRIDSLEVVTAENEEELARIDAKLSVAAEVHRQFADEYLSARKQADSLMLAISRRQPKLAHETETAAALAQKVRGMRGELAALEAKRARLARNVELIGSSYNRFAQLAEDARIAKAERPSDLKVAAMAVVAKPVSQEKGRQVVVLAAAAGLVLSVFLAFFLEYLGKARERLAVE